MKAELGNEAGHSLWSGGATALAIAGDTSPKEYPSFRSIHDPLHIYFNILMHQLITLGSPAPLTLFAHSSTKYMSGLYKLYLKYEWPQVLEYHFKFHNCHIVEMQDGIYNGWAHMDVDLMAMFLFSHPKAQQIKPASQQSGSGTKDISKQVCHAFTYDKCASPCKTGRTHKCRKCNLMDHGAVSCTKAD